MPDFTVSEDHEDKHNIELQGPEGPYTFTLAVCKGQLSYYRDEEIVEPPLTPKEQEFVDIICKYRLREMS